MTAPGFPIYDKIEFCSNPKALWGKIASGRYDWLGVNTKHKYVVGSPRAPGGRIRPPGFSTSASAETKPGEYGAGSCMPGTPWGNRWTDNAEDARSEYVRLRRQLEEGQGDKPMLYKIRLITDGSVEDEDYIVSLPTNYR